MQEARPKGNRPRGKIMVDILEILVVAADPAVELEDEVDGQEEITVSLGHESA